MLHNFFVYLKRLYLHAVTSFFMFNTLNTISKTTESLRSQEHFCRYLGFVALVLEKETSKLHLEQQVVTELAESLDTEMGTHAQPISLYVEAGELRDTDARSMSASAARWSALQSQRAEQDPGLTWFARIAAHEAQEHTDVVMFAESAQIGDTLLVVSPFPEEPYQSPHTKEYVAAEGFRPDLLRAFIRAYEKTDEGIHEHIQSVDSSASQLWSSTFERIYGETTTMQGVTSLEILAQRRLFKATPAVELVERLAMAYDDTMFIKTGKLHRYGRSPGATREANNFVRCHMPIVQDTIAELSEITERGHLAAESAERILYNSKALIKELFNESNVRYIADVRTERNEAGTSAAAQGDVFYGCSGASSAIGEQVQQLSHSDSYTLKNGIEEVAIGSCPVCGAECIKGYRDAKTKRFTSCSNKKCKSYSQSVIDAFNGKKGTTQDKTITDIFAELLAEFFAPKKQVKS
jgi:hypothetical protein